MNNCEAKPRIKDMAKGVIKQHELYDNLVEMTEETWQEYVTIAKAFMSTNTVEVVRCKDCKHWHSNTEFCSIWSFQNIAQRTLREDYCSRAERKEG